MKIERLSASAVVSTLDTAPRTIRGLILPFGPVGRTNLGLLTASARSVITVPDDLARIKLVDLHDADNPLAIGFCTELETTPAGLTAAFKVARTPDGDRALAEYGEGVKDGLSVEMYDLDIAPDGHLNSGLLGQVAMVPVPAWTDARILELAAAAAAQAPANRADSINQGDKMTDEQRARLAELLALNTRTPEQEAEYAELAGLAAAEAVAPATPAEPAPPAEPAAPLAAARVPAGVTPTRVKPKHTLKDLYAALARVSRGQSRAHLEAALSDITQGDNIYVTQNAYEGELWSGVAFQRRFVSLMTQKDLTSYKGSGWRWVTRPAVSDYAGDKADVPSNAPTTENAPWTAARLAGVHDIDRKFWDFHDEEFIAAYYQAMTESYAYKSDLKARAFIAASATAMTDAPVGTDILGLALRAKLQLENGEDDGRYQGTPDYYLVNPADYLTLLDTTAADVSAFLDALGISPESFIPTTGTAVGTVTAGVKPAATFYELPGSPIRVETVNIAEGGVDGGVFGYYATLLNDAKGIVKIKAAAS